MFVISPKNAYLDDYQESPTQQRLAALQSRMAMNNEKRFASPERARNGSNLGTTEMLSPEPVQRLSPRADGLQDTLAEQNQRVDDNAQKIEEMRRCFDRLSMDMENEEQKRKTMSSTFMKNFALKIEERFLKLEASLNTQARSVTAADEARLHQAKTIEARLVAADERMTEIEREAETARDTTHQQWVDHEDRLRAVTKELQLMKEAGADREGSLWKRLSDQTAALRTEIDEDRRRQRAADEERVKTIDEGVQFIKEGRDQWLRMFDYKLTPFRQTREDAESRLDRKTDELAHDMATLQRKVRTVADEGAMDAIQTTLRDLEGRMDGERVMRERTEEQMARLLEGLIEREE